jgi:hypothetical protein
MDLILHNGNIITMDEKCPKASAVAIKNGKVVVVGYDADILKLTGENTKVFDLRMKTVVPGFNDSHLHNVKYGIFSNCCDLSKCASLQELIDVTRKFINDNNIKPGNWVIGTGWNQDLFDVKLYPTKADLDLISKDHPIVMFRCCSHLLLANSKAVEILGIDERTLQVKGGYFDVNLGLFRETAKELVQVSIKSYDVPTLKSIIKKSCEDLLKQGITSIHTDDFNMSVDYKRIIQAYSELAEEGNLPVRVTQQCLVVNQEELEGFINCNYKGLNINDFYRIGPVKILADGSLGSRSAALREPYADAPNMKGILIHNEHELKKMVETCQKFGYYVTMHCIGDKALELAIDSIDYAREKYPHISLRHGIVHCQITDENLLNRIIEMDLLIYAQPIFLNYDLHIVDDRIGKRLASSSYNFGRLVRNGVHLSMGTDSPVEKFNPMENIYCAVTRKDMNGYPKGGFYPEQSITVEESIKAYTCESAYCSYEENIKGKIKNGYFADMTVLTDDIYNISHEKLLDVKVKMTIVDGIIRYESNKDA